MALNASARDGETRQRFIGVAKENEYAQSDGSSLAAQSYMIRRRTVATTRTRPDAQGAQDAAVTGLLDDRGEFRVKSGDEAQEIGLLRSFPVDGVVIRPHVSPVRRRGRRRVGMPVGARQCARAQR